MGIPSRHGSLNASSSNASSVFCVERQHVPQYLDDERGRLQHCTSARRWPRYRVVGRTTLIAGCAAAGALVLLFFYPRTPFTPRCSVPPAWLAPVLGVGCLSMSLPVLIKFLTAPRADFFGLKIGPSIGWRLWLLTVSSVVLTVTAAIAATHLGLIVEPAWARNWTWAAIVTSVLIEVATVLRRNDVSPRMIRRGAYATACR